MPLPRVAAVVCALAVAAAASCATLVAAAPFAGVEVAPPLPPGDVVDVHWGTPVPDPYRHLEDTRDPAVAGWMQAQAAATRAILARLPGRAALAARLREIDAGSGAVLGEVERTRSGRLFFLRRDAGDSQFKLYRRDGADGEDVVVFDPQPLSRSTGQPHAVMDFAASPDGRRIAYALQAGGGEIGTLHVVDVATGRELVAPLDRIRFASAHWLPDGSGLFYTRLPADYRERPRAERFSDTERRFLALEPAAADTLVLSARSAPGLGLPPHAVAHVVPVAGTATAAAIVHLGVERHLQLLVAPLADATRGSARWQRVIGADDAVVEVAAGGGWIYLRSARGTPRFRVLRVPAAAPDLTRAETVIDEGPGVIVHIAAAADALYVTRRDGAVLSLLRVAHGGAPKIETVALPLAGNVRIVAAAADVPGVVVELGGWTRAATTYRCDPSAALAPLPLAEPGRYDAPAGIVAREVRVRSHDGVEVPLSVLARADLALDGSHPTILYGYGAYGTTEDPAYSARLLAWLERGGVFAIAHVRGGGAFGDDWHRAGRKATKPNTWKDGIAAATWLIGQGYTRPGRLAVYGGSAGGIFVGRAITERPELFAAAVVAVGNTDLIRSETRANGAANVAEYGTVTDEAEFRALLAMSPYASIRPGTRYPAVLFEHGVNDIRVDVWMATKTASRLAAASTSGRPVLLRLDYDGGHGSGATREQALERTADRWAFLLWQFGDPGFQPPP